MYRLMQSGALGMKRFMLNFKPKDGHQTCLKQALTVLRGNNLMIVVYKIKYFTLYHHLAVYREVIIVNVTPVAKNTV